MAVARHKGGPDGRRLMPDIQIAELTPNTRSAWDAYVNAHPDSTVSHHRAWQVAATAAYPVREHSLVAHRPDGALAGVLPLFLVDNKVAPYAVTGVFGAYGRVLADSPELGLGLLQEAWSRMRRAGARHLLHKSVGAPERAPEDWHRSDAALTAVLSLEQGPEALWKGFRSEIRNRIRKAERAGLEPRSGSGEFEGFYDVLAANMHRKGTPTYGRPFLRSLLTAFGDRAEILTLRHNGRVIAGAFVVEHRGVVNVPFVSARAEFFALAPANLLYWEIMRRGCGRGMTTLDFGRSFRDTSNLDFKTRFGAAIVPQPFLFAHSGAPPHVEPGDPSVQRLVRVWQSLPRGLADRLGPWICGRFLV